MTVEQLLPGVYRFADSCNVYAVDDGDSTIVVDYGSGTWRDTEVARKLSPIAHILLTHHHADQCSGLARSRPPGCIVHAPAGDAALLRAADVEALPEPPRSAGVPASYLPLAHGLHDIVFDLAAYRDLYWGEQRVRFLSTPGHGQHALAVIVNCGRQQLVFCGDAAHAGGTIHQPFNLEWNHWTGEGTLAAWEGIQRLRGIRIDLLCPAHGPVIRERPQQTLRLLSRRLLDFHRAKGQISAGAADDYLPSTAVTEGARRVLPNLHQFGGNGWLLTSAAGTALVVDATLGDLAALDGLLAALGRPTVTAVVATHYHYDHSDGIPELQRRYGARCFLHPLVAAPLADPDTWRVPYLPQPEVVPDELWPTHGEWCWENYRFRVAPFPGQTWWHCCFMTEIDGQRVFFGGDSFQPATRWNGTGGFCAYNGSRFIEGFAASAQLVLDWRPRIVACGHATYVRFRASRFRKIQRWAAFAESATRALCPTGDLEQDYYLHSDKQGC